MGECIATTGIHLVALEPAPARKLLPAIMNQCMGKTAQKMETKPSKNLLERNVVLSKRLFIK
jgi:hypothetical protein